jgi:hypothetical protein
MKFKEEVITDPLSYSFTVPIQAAGCGANTSLISFNRAGLAMP